MKPRRSRAGTEAAAAITSGKRSASDTPVKSLKVSYGRRGLAIGLMAWVSKLTSKVLPSGADLATYWVAPWLAAPGRFSITTGRPSFSDRRGRTMRAALSGLPPGGCAQQDEGLGAVKGCIGHGQTPGLGQRAWVFSPSTG